MERQSILRWFNPFLWVSILVFLPAAFVWYQLYTAKMQSLPPVQVLTQLNVTVPSSAGAQNAVLLGQVELGQTNGSDSADIRHIAIYGGDNGPHISNVSSQRLIAFTYENDNFLNTDYPLNGGETFTIGNVDYEVAIDGDKLELFLDDRKIGTLPDNYGTEQSGLRQWESRSMSLGGEVQHNPSVLENLNPIQKFKRLIDAYIFLRSAPDIIVAQPGIPENSIRISRQRSGYKMRISRNRLVLICPDGASSCAQVGQQQWPILGDARLGDLRSLIAGRTEYDLSADAEKISLRPTSREHWLTEDALARPGLDTKKTYTAAEYSKPFKRGLPSAGQNAPSVIAGLLALANPLFDLQFLLMLGALMLVAGPYIWANPLPRFVGVIASLLILQAVTPALMRELPTPSLNGPFFWLALASLAFGPLLRLRTQAFRLVRTGQWRQWRDVLARFKTQITSGPAIARIMATLLLITCYMTLKPETDLTPDLRNSLLFSSHVAIILLFLLGTLAMMYTLAVHSAGGTVLFLFWGSVMVICALGAMSLAHLALGYRYALHLLLFERHLMAIGLMAGLVVLTLVTDRWYLLDTIKAALRKSYMGSIVRWRTIFAFIFGIPLCILLLVLWRNMSPELVTQLGHIIVEQSFVLQAAVVFGIVVVLAIVFFLRKQIWRWLRQPVTIPSMLLFGPSIALGLLVFVTPETGIFGIQPSEMAKTWLALLLALILAAGMERREWMLSFESGRSTLALFLQFLIIALFFGAGSVINFDLSPIAIIAIMVMFSFTSLMFFSIMGAMPVLLRIAIVCVFVFGFIGPIIGSRQSALLACVLLTMVSLQSGALAKKIPAPSISMVRAPWYRGASTLQTGLLRDVLLWFTPLKWRSPIVVAAVLVAILTLSNLMQATQELTDQRRLSTLQVKVLGLSVPAVPQERLLSYMDASLQRQPNEDGINIIEHPDLSLQVRRSREVLAATGCGLIETTRANIPEMFRTPHVPLHDWWTQQRSNVSVAPDVCPPYPAIFPFKGAVPAAVSAVPAIQDDFATTFLLASFGLDAAPVLMIAQVLLLTCMAIIAANAVVRTADYPSFRGVGLFGAVAVGNLSVILLCQFVLSWGNMLGLFAVVGQPMTFVSLGASHHMAFALPAIVLPVMISVISNAHSLQPRAPKPLYALSLRKHILSAQPH
jgi:hypothetical protein